MSCGHWAWRSPSGELQRFFCGSGGCKRPECRNLFWSRRVRLISALISEYGLVRFFTLTLDRNMIPFSDDPWDYIHSPWLKLRKRIHRQHENFKFVAILEGHKNKKYPHIHGFTNVWIPQVDWSIMWHECRGGDVVWIEQVKEGDISKYVSKEIEVARYVGKENLSAGYKHRKNKHTLWRSKGLRAKYELDTTEGWSIIKESVFGDLGVMRDFFAKKGLFDGSKEK